jgi:hypothetical protein
MFVAGFFKSSGWCFIGLGSSRFTLQVLISLRCIPGFSLQSGLNLAVI